jgi:hypothetical protein
MRFVKQSKLIFSLLIKRILKRKGNYSMSNKQKQSKISSTEMVKKLAEILKNGIYLGEMTAEERKNYQADLIQHISSSVYFSAFYDYETNTVMVETKYFDPLLCIDVTQDSIYFLPLSDKGYYEAFMKVAEFILLQKKKRNQEMLEKEEEKEVKKEMPNFDFL